MNTKKSITKLALAVTLVCAAFGTSSAQAATDAEIVTAIDKGLAYLHAQQQAGGNWSYWGGTYDDAATGAAAYAMLTQKSHWGSNAAAYQADVDKAIRFLLNNALGATVSTRNDAVNICPGGGSCAAAYWYGNGESSYTTGLIAPAIALYAAGNPAGVSSATSGPLVGKTWGDIAQSINNTWAASQSTANQGALIGGWRYGLNDGYDSDMSTTQWGIISLAYDKTLGASQPAILNTDLAKWLAFAQDPTSGAGCYQGPGSGLCDHADTGGLLVGLGLIGKPVSDGAVQKALSFVNSNWRDAGSGWYGNFGHPYAMWSIYKGLETNIGITDTATITNLRPGDCGGDRGTDCNWWQDYNEWLVSNQRTDGSWAGADYWTDPLATAFYLPILGGTVIPDGGDTPEPGTLALLAGALLGMRSLRRKGNTQS